MDESLESIRIRPRHKWNREAACAKLPKRAREKFLESREGRPSKDDPRIAVCDSCPVKLECLAFAIVHNEDGIWGGTSPGERKKVPSQIRKALTEKAHREGWYETLKFYLPTTPRSQEEDEPEDQELEFQDDLDLDLECPLDQPVEPDLFPLVPAFVLQ